MEGAGRALAVRGMLHRRAAPLIAATMLTMACGYGGSDRDMLAQKSATRVVGPRPTVTSASASTPIPSPTPNQSLSGAQLYRSKCAICHGLPTNYHRSLSRFDEMANYVDLDVKQEELVREYLAEMVRTPPTDPELLQR